MFASKAVQREVMDACQKAFVITPLLLRYPAGDGHPAHEPNATRPFGYHDDSFAWATLETGEKKDAWFHLPALRQAATADGLRLPRHRGGGGRGRHPHHVLNQGVAPFYYPWKARLLVLDAAGQQVGAEIGSEHSLQGILPGEPVTWEQKLASPAGPRTRFLMQVPNQLKTGKPVRFANELQDANRDGWLTLAPAR